MTTPLRLGCSLAIALGLSAASAHGAEVLRLAADLDDDDANGVADRMQGFVDESPELRAVRRETGDGPGLASITGDPIARVLVDGRPIAVGARVPDRAKRVEIQATGAGRATVDLFGRAIELRALEVIAVDGAGKRVDFTRSQASLQRTPPDRLPEDPYGPTGDPDAVRFVLAGRADDLPGTLTIDSLDAGGAEIDVLRDLPLAPVPCPEGVASGLSCGSTLPIRAVTDEIDRDHPIVIGRSIEAELGGALVVQAGNDVLQVLRVAGPRASSVGPIARYRARLRVMVLRASPRGAPCLGGDAAGAVQAAQAEVAKANALWAGCGVSFGPPRDLDVSVIDPPPSHLLALGCDAGVPASGGTIRVRVDGKRVTAAVAPGMLPEAAARVVAAAIARAGFSVKVSDNAATGAGAYGSSDVLVRRAGGALASITADGGPVSTDRTMTACIGRVDPIDGLQHFGDVDAIAGTVEERTLIKAYDDGDPSTIEVFLIPSFSLGGRIGESFIDADGGAIRNTILEDRAGVRADRSSFALAHELGHVLLDDPGHPDDFGADTPTRLMDSDATNASAYGPRRLLVEECARAIRQSGPGSSSELLRPWPLAPLGRER